MRNTDSMEGIDFMAETAFLRLTTKYSNRVGKVSYVHFS